MLTLYHYPLSPCSDKVRFALAEKGLAWREVILDLSRKENLTPAYLALNPKGYVPTLLDGDHVLVESTAILDYLQAAFPDPTLVPAAPHLVARMRLWLKLVDERLHPAWPGLAWPILVRPRWLSKARDEVAHMLDQLLDPARRARQTRLYEQGFASPDTTETMIVLGETLDAMERTLRADEWLAGECFSLADIALLPYVHAADVFGLAPIMFLRRPRTETWFETCRARASFAAGGRIDWPRDRIDEMHAAAAEARDALGSGRAATAAPAPAAALGRPGPVG